MGARGAAFNKSNTLFGFEAVRGEVVAGKIGLVAIGATEGLAAKDGGAGAAAMGALWKSSKSSTGREN